MSREEWEALHAVAIALAYLASTAMFGDAERAAVGKAMNAIAAIEPPELSAARTQEGSEDA